ncbi:hypothetical protein [Mycolicibacterium conceptionense]|uniref:hypothetical protein n=1 Tax=Mycolicibacterium conceptionense TaxID=451644 RepID=UPI000AD6E0AC|nr:hypothetical protein [Mycolicibacterium conceptionense]
MSIDFSTFAFHVDTNRYVHVTCTECGDPVMPAMWSDGQISDITESCREHAEATGHGR